MNPSPVGSWKGALRLLAYANVALAGVSALLLLVGASRYAFLALVVTLVGAGLCFAEASGGEEP